MDRLLSAVGPVGPLYIRTRARARAVYGQAAPRPAYLNLHVKSRCRAFKRRVRTAHVHTQVRRKRRGRSLVAVQLAFALPFESVHTLRDGDLSHGSPAGVA